MKKTLVFAFIAAAAVTSVGFVFADGERYEREHEEHEGFSLRRWFGGAEPEQAAGAYAGDADYALYRQNCGECHLPYPPPLLPQASWKKLMDGLADHFGDNAELDRNNAETIRAYLDRHAAGPDRGRYGARMHRATAGQAPTRITETDYFRAKHHEIPTRMVTDNPKVASFSQCQDCHPGAEQGNFDEHQVVIEGYGRWDD